MKELVFLRGLYSTANHDRYSHKFSSWPTIPQLYISGEFVGGCDIVLQMHQSGELETALVAAGISDPIPDAPAA